MSDPPKKKGLQLKQENPMEFIKIGQQFIKGYYTALNTRNYPILNSLLRFSSSFSIKGQKGKGNTAIISAFTKLHSNIKLTYHGMQYDVMLSGSRRINIMVIGKARFLNVAGALVEERFTEYVHLGQDNKNKMWIHLSMFTTDSVLLRPQNGIQFINMYYSALNNRNYNILNSLFKSFSHISVQNKRSKGNQNILTHYKRMFDESDVKFSSISFDVMGTGPERTNFLVTGNITLKIKTIDSDEENESEFITVTKRFSEFIHKGCINPNKKKKLKKKAIRMAHQNTNNPSPIWIQTTMLQLS